MKGYLICLVVCVIAISPIRMEAAERKSVSTLVDEIQRDCAEKWGFAGPIAICIGDKESEYGEELARAYQKALARAGTNAPLLRQSQRGWLKFQELNCKFRRQIGAIEGPSFGLSSMKLCELRSTLQRLDELRELVEGAEADHGKAR